MSGDEPVVRPLEPPIPAAIFEYLVNPVVTAILRSPIHGLVSGSLVLIAVTGRKSGREYTTPVGYEQRDGTLYITSQTDRRWWTNVRGGASVRVWLRGTDRTGTATVIEDDAAVADYVREYIDRHGIEAVTRLGLAIEGDAIPDRATFASGLAETVVVRVELDGT